MMEFSARCNSLINDVSIADFWLPLAHAPSQDNGEARAPRPVSSPRFCSAIRFSFSASWASSAACLSLSSFKFSSSTFCLLRSRRWSATQLLMICTSAKRAHVRISKGRKSLSSVIAWPSLSHCFKSLVAFWSCFVRSVIWSLAELRSIDAMVETRFQRLWVGLKVLTAELYDPARHAFSTCHVCWWKAEDE